MLSNSLRQFVITSNHHRQTTLIDGHEIALRPFRFLDSMINQNRAEKVSENMERRTTKTKLPGAGANRRQTTPSRICGRAGNRLLGVLRRFNSDTSGAVTVEFVVLTAAIVSMGVMAAGAISAGVESSIARTESCLAHTAGNLEFKEGLSALQKKQETGQRCEPLFSLEVISDEETPHLKLCSNSDASLDCS